MDPSFDTSESFFTVVSDLRKVFEDQPDQFQITQQNHRAAIAMLLEMGYIYEYFETTQAGEYPYGPIHHPAGWRQKALEKQLRCMFTTAE